MRAYDSTYTLSQFVRCTDRSRHRLDNALGHRSRIPQHACVVRCNTAFVCFGAQ